MSIDHIATLAEIMCKPSLPFDSVGRSGRRTIRAANDNKGRRVIVGLLPPTAITTAEIEVFGAFLAEIEAANDNLPVGGVS